MEGRKEGGGSCLKQRENRQKSSKCFTVENEELREGGEQETVHVLRGRLLLFSFSAKKTTHRKRDCRNKWGNMKRGRLEDEDRTRKTDRMVLNGFSLLLLYFCFYLNLPNFM